MTRTIPFHFQQYPIAIAPSPTTAKTSTTSVASIVGKPLLISLHTKSKMSRVQSHVTTSMPISKKQRSPLEVLRSILFEEPGGNSDNNSSTSTVLTKEDSIKNATISFQTPLKTDMEDYDLESVRAIRASDVERLRELHRGGKSLDACNAFGESLLHMACRRGDVKVVRFLVEEIRVRSDRCDDFGRNPLHDAMWTSTPNTEVIDVLIDHIDPSMFLAEDVRGNTPFAYARREHDVKWIEFLEQRREKLRQRYNAFLSLKDAETTNRTISAVPAESAEVASTEREANADEKRSTDAATSGLV